MTFIPDDAENASDITISKRAIESLTGREIDLDEWDEFRHDLDYMHCIDEAAADAFMRLSSDGSSASIETSPWAGGASRTR